MRRALIDTGAIYAFVVRTDENHPAAVQFVSKWVKKPGVFVLLDIVFFEIMTLLKARTGAGVAVRTGRELRRSPLYVWTALTSEMETETWAAFQKYDDKSWSYTDCGLLVASRRLKVPEVFSFDDDFKQMPGLRRIPA